jgi:hypothetical protein
MQGDHGQFNPEYFDMSAVVAPLVGGVGLAELPRATLEEVGVKY